MDRPPDPRPVPPAPPAPSSPDGGPLGRWFEPVKIPHGAEATLRELAARGSLVFVMRSPGLLNFLYLRWFLRRLGLPPLRAAQGFRGLSGWLARVRRTRRAFEDAVASGEASVVFLGRRDRRDPFVPLARLQRGLFQPALLVPVLLVWSRRPQRLQPSLWDVLYGTPDAPSAFANAIAFLRNFRRAVFEVGRPVDLKAFLAERAGEPDAAIARKVRGALAQHLARVFRTAVGPPLKAPSRVEERVLRDRSLRAALEAVSAQAGRSPAAVTAEARRDLREIASRYDPRFVQVARPLLASAFGRMYTSVEVDEEGLARVKRAASAAPVVLCPSHKSHVDYLILSWLFYEHGMTPPHVAAGINLAFWPFGPIARRGGAFFIRRKVRGDRVYTAVLRAYVKHLLRDRFPQEFYVEGGRSRTGKLLPPKAGLLSMEVDAWLDGAAEDVLFVPIAIDYEKLIEASSYARELAGGEKVKESWRGLLGAARVLFRRYERIHVQFETPLSLAELARARLGEGATALPVDEAWGGEAERTGSMALAAGDRSAPAGAKRQLVQALANRVAWGIGRAVTITPVGLVAAALLSHVRRGLTAAEVGRRVELLLAIASEGGARLAKDLAGAPLDPRQPGPIADAVRRLGQDGLVRVEVAAGDTIYLVADERRPVLDYHRNAVIHRYVAPALVAAAVRSGGAGLPEATARERAHWLSRLFKLEFSYRPGATADEIFDQQLAFLERIGAVARGAGTLGPGSAPDLLAFLGEFLRAYLEAYRLAAETALALLGPDAPRHAPAERRALIREALERGRADFLAGRIALRESLSKATLENALEWLVVQGILAEEGGKLRLARSGDASELRGIMDGIAPHLVV
ncbi:MAG TPA: 1-acyl-sn-glycerol-3-phosphate acyltransferase [Anaeromyxobacter sp.]|nr:1-acyl-sn-glycerol-3-phosphate acyltransferase [Anaeromyxobacter sp.]